MTQVQRLEFKKNLILINTRELSRISSIDESILYTSSIQSVHTLHLAHPKCYESYISELSYHIIYDIILLDSIDII